MSSLRRESVSSACLKHVALMYTTSIDMYCFKHTHFNDTDTFWAHFIFDRLFYVTIHKFILSISKLSEALSSASIYSFLFRPLAPAADSPHVIE